MTKSTYWLSSLLILVALSTFAGPPNIDKALDEQQALISNRPSDAQLHNDLGNLLVLDEGWEAAEVAYRRAIELAPGDPSARFNLALLDEQQGRLDAAKEGLLAVLEISPYHGRAHYQLGMIHHAKGDRNKALERYARAFAADPTLTFASVNPHIIENDLRTEAMLTSTRYETSTQTQQPRVYDQPERIRDLMIEADVMAEEIAEDADMATKKSEARPAREILEDDDDDMSYEERLDDYLEDDEQPAAAPRVLSRETLETRGGSSSRTRRRPSGVGSGSGSSYRPPSASDEGGGRGNGVSRIGAGNRSNPSRSEGSASEGSGSSEATRPATRPRRVGRGYRAGVGSTGSLNLDLLPLEGPGGASSTDVTVAAKR